MGQATLPCLQLSLLTNVAEPQGLRKKAGLHSCDSAVSKQIPVTPLCWELSRLHTL